MLACVQMCVCAWLAVGVQFRAGGSSAPCGGGSDGSCSGGIELGGGTLPDPLFQKSRITALT